MRPCRIERPLGDPSFLWDAHLREETAWEPPNNRFIRKIAQGTVTFHLPPAHGPCPVVLLCPGGGYAGVSIDKEGHHLASWLNQRNIGAAVLKYRLPEPPEHHTPRPVVDFFAALREIALEPRLDEKRVVSCGFSAGGHLAGLCSLHFAELATRTASSAPPPTGAALIYPVVSMRAGLAHDGCQANLLGANPPAEIADFFSLESAVGTGSPPLFLVHSADDPSVPIRHSEVLAAAAAAAGVPCELHRYETGGHGYGMAPTSPTRAWVDEFGRWLARVLREPACLDRSP